MSYAVKYKAEPVKDEELRVCRVCFATDTKLFSLHSNRLAETFGELTGIPISVSDGFPQHVCSFCSSLLFKFTAFRDRCWAANTYLQNAHFTDNLTTAYLQKLDQTCHKMHLIVTNALSIDIPPDNIHTVDIETNDVDVDLTVDHEDSKDLPDNEEYVSNNQEIVVSDESYSNIACYKYNVDLTEIKSDEDTLSKNNEESSKDSDQDFPDCLLGINSDIFTKDTKKNFKVAKPVIVKECSKVKKDKKRKRPVRKVSKKLKIDDEISEEDSTSETEVKCKRRKKLEEDKVVQRKKRKKLEKEKVNTRYKYRTNEQLENLSKMYNVEIVMLTKEEQRKEVEERRETPNYKNSYFKCEQCFKGYSVEAAFKNHLAVHGPNAGNEICDICGFRFHTRKRLNDHLKSHTMNLICRDCGNVSKTPVQAKHHFNWHGGLKYVCEHCGKDFDKQSSRSNHVRNYHGSATCQICGEAFIGETGLAVHMKKTHKESLQSRCLSCGVQFHGMAALHRHLNNSPDNVCEPNIRPCAECGDNFTTDDLLKLHMQERHRQEISCEKCEKTFKNERLYRTHCFRDHQVRGRRPNGYRGTEPAPHQARNVYKKTKCCMCEVCGLKFTNEAALKVHQRVHTGEKPHQCPMCPKTFRIKTLLQIHVNTHTGERPYECHQCSKAFKSQTARHRHQLVHTKARPYTCPLCGKTYQQSTAVKIHIRTAHLKEAWPRRVRNKTKPGLQQE